MALGIVIRRRMKEKNIGNKELSDITGISLSTINNVLYETTKDPSVNIITAIAKALDCSIDELVEDMENPDRLTSSEEKLINLFRQMNAEGQEKLIDNALDMVASGRYIKNNEFDMVGQKKA